jgi:large subunit ribosomal protein L28
VQAPGIDADESGEREGRRLYSPAMAKVCHVCRKGPAFGNSRSHSMVATRRRFNPNLQRVRIDDNGTPRRVYVCTRCLKAGKVSKAQ